MSIFTQVNGGRPILGRHIHESSCWEFSRLYIFDKSCFFPFWLSFFKGCPFEITSRQRVPCVFFRTEIHWGSLRALLFRVALFLLEGPAQVEPELLRGGLGI